MQEIQVRALGQEDPLEKAMAAHSSILAWRIPWTEEHGGLQSIESQSISHDWNDFSMHTGIKFGYLFLFIETNMNFLLVLTRLNISTMKIIQIILLINHL